MYCYKCYSLARGGRRSSDFPANLPSFLARFRAISGRHSSDVLPMPLRPAILPRYSIGCQPILKSWRGSGRASMLRLWPGKQRPQSGGPGSICWCGIYRGAALTFHIHLLHHSTRRSYFHSAWDSLCWGRVALARYRFKVIGREISQFLGDDIQMPDVGSDFNAALEWIR